MDSARYDRVLQACALLPDLQLLPAGDQTEIGKTALHVCLLGRHMALLLLLFNIPDCGKADPSSAGAASAAEL